MLPYVLIGLGILLLIIYFLTKDTNPSPKKEQVPAKAEKNKTQIVQKPNYGQVCIFFGSQTGTSAKLSQQLAEEGTQLGFEPEVVDLKNIQISHFQGTNRISIFLLSNTGEGDPPDNAVHFLNILKGKQSLDQVKELDWSKVNFTIFGLGNTQYEHYNQTGRVVNKLLQKKGCKTVYQMGEGDDNCSLEDDFAEWKKNLWSTLISFRKNNPLVKESSHIKMEKRKSAEVHSEGRPISKTEPILANYRIFTSQNNERQIFNEESFDFKTKASLKAEKAEVSNISQMRQDEKDGSTLYLQVQLQGHPQYQTGGNIALYPKNDPSIVKQIINYFNLDNLDVPISIVELKADKKLKLNFVPNTLRTLLQESIDIQGRITKSILKKLSKFQSKNPQYFIDNCSVKTTEQFKRISQKTDSQHWYNLFRIVKEFEVKLTFQDFVELSDSMAPRLFTIASHAKTQKNVVIAASLVENGLISKFFLEKPKNIRAELRKSAFTDAMKWKKVIFIAAGTGFAPFRGFLQQKVYNMKQNANTPIVTLFFGCKHETGDFICKDEILGWRDKGVINRLHLAFSRDTQKKVYVQNLLQQEQDQLKELGFCKQTAIYICGSLPMGASIIDVMTKSFGGPKVKEMQHEGRIIKQLW